MFRPLLCYMIEIFDLAENWEKMNWHSFEISAKFHLYPVARGTIWLAKHVSVKLRNDEPSLTTVNQNRVSVILDFEKS